MISVFRKILSIIKKIVMAVMFIYAYNKIALPFDVLIPINYITILLVSFFGIPSIPMLVLYSIVFL